MRKIVDGKLYDTENAQWIDSYSFGDQGDFRFVAESLYRTHRGNYFLDGEGGAMSKYGRRVSQTARCGGEDIVPLSEDEARKWLETYGDANTYIATFGKPEEA